MNAEFQILVSLAAYMLAVLGIRYWSVWKARSEADYSVGDLRLYYMGN